MVSTRPKREAKNTYGLPQGEGLRRELVRWFRRQREVMLSWLATGKKSDAILRDVGGGNARMLPLREVGLEGKAVTPGDLPGSVPDWDWFGLGALPMSERMTPHLETIWDDAGRKFTAKIGLDPAAWEVTNPKTQEAIDKAALDFCAETNATTTLDLNDALTKTREALGEGLITHGESVADLTKRIKKIFTGAETWRARRIATSEASRAVHSAQEMQGAESGVVTGWEWLLSEDACPLCITVSRRAKFVRMGQPFAIVGTNPTYSTIKHPPLHPGCQCALAPVLDIDKQPKWSPTLEQPEPEEQDYAEGEAPERAKPKRPPPPKAVKPKPLPVKPPKPMGPSGPPVSGAVNVQSKSPAIERAAKATLEIIDKIHGDGRLPKIPLIDTNKGADLGFIHIDGKTLKPVGIAIHQKGPTPRLTVAHETGHFLDWSGIPATHRTPKGGIDFRKEPRFNGLLGAIDRSEASQSLAKLTTQTTVTVTQGTITSQLKIDQKHVAYLRQDHEFFARAYSQYIATKSEDPDMKAELEHELRFGAKRVYTDQWDHKDFEPIAREFDRLFKGLGWVK